jgi:glycosyltransferase involved in cell wall biosynthesis
VANHEIKLAHNVIAASVIICSHNPRSDYLRRVLEALRVQALTSDQWELLLIDNASERALAREWDLSWHPLARHIREGELGLTAARLRGIAEARGEILVFVDDDNVVDQDYLRTAIDIGRDYPFLGAWGGTIRGEFEAEPQGWMSPLLPYLGIREISSPVWSNNPEDWLAQPCGAGMCVRRSVTTAYAAQLLVSPARRRLDRIGSKLSSCGDSDLIQTSCDLGQGFGNFPELCLTHLIPKKRVQPEYLIRLMQGIAASSILLRYLRTGDLAPVPSTLKVWLRYVLTFARRGRHQAWIYKASQEATREGIRMARQIGDRQTAAESKEAIRISPTNASP